MNGIGQFRQGMQLLGPGGTLTPEAQLYFSRQNQYIQTNLSPNGYVHPNLSTADATGQTNTAKGTTIFNTDLGKLQVFNGTAWETITSA